MALSTSPSWECAHGFVEDRLLLAEGELRGLGAVASHVAPAHLQRRPSRVFTAAAKSFASYCACASSMAAAASATYSTHSGSPVNLFTPERPTLATTEPRAGTGAAPRARERWQRAQLRRRRRRRRRAHVDGSAME